MNRSMRLEILLWRSTIFRLHLNRLALTSKRLDAALGTITRSIKLSARHCLTDVERRPQTIPTQ